MRAAGARLKWSLLLVGLCGWLAACLGVLLLLFAFDYLLSLPAGLRLPLALGGALFCGVLFFQKVLRVAWRRQRPERTALMLEARYGIRDNLLINAVQFQRQSLSPRELPFAARTVAASEDIASRLRFGELWDWPKLRAWGGAALAAVLVWAAVIAFFPRQLGAAAARYALPLSDVPPPGNCVLKLTPAGDLTVAEGENLEVRVDVEKSSSSTPLAPPLIAWREKSDFIQPAQSGGEHRDDGTAGAVRRQNRRRRQVCSHLRQHPDAFRLPRLRRRHFHAQRRGESPARAAPPECRLPHHAARLHRAKAAHRLRPARSAGRAGGIARWKSPSPSNRQCSP